jgi:hypothetical protein
MPPRAKGLGKPRRQNRNFRKGRVGNKKIKNLKKTRMGRVGLSAALALKTLKRHEPAVSTSQVWKTDGLASDARPDNLQASPPDRCIAHHPYYLAKSATRSETDRECDNIYMFNSRGQFEVLCPDTLIKPIVIRKVMGWAKGVPDANSGTGPTQAKTPWAISTTSALSYYAQTPECTFPPDYFKMIFDKQITISPKQVYYDGSSTKAIWAPFKFNFNFKFNRKVMYDGDNALDSIGWIPFVAILHYTSHGDASTTSSLMSSNTHPSPTVVLDTHSFFKDC